MITHPSTYTLQSALVNQVIVNSWIPLCRTTDLNRRPVYNIDFLDKSITVSKKGNIYHVFDDRCPHRGAKLSDGDFDGECISCPYHNMEFDIEGGKCEGFIGDYNPKLIKAKLEKYETKVFDDIVWACIGDSSPEFIVDKLDLHPPGVEDDLVSIYGQRDVNSNMFEVVENLLDNLHISVVHSWGNQESLPMKTIRSRSERGNYFHYKYGGESIAGWMGGTESDIVTVFNGFVEPLSTLSRVCFGEGCVKSVRVHLLPLGNNKTRMFWGLHRNFFTHPWMDWIFRFFIEKTINEDKVIVENMNPNGGSYKQSLTAFDWLIIEYRNRVKTLVGKNNEE